MGCECFKNVKSLCHVRGFMTVRVFTLPGGSWEERGKQRVDGGEELGLQNCVCQCCEVLAVTDCNLMASHWLVHSN